MCHQKFLFMLAKFSYIHMHLCLIIQNGEVPCNIWYMYLFSEHLPCAQRAWIRTSESFLDITTSSNLVAVSLSWNFLFVVGNHGHHNSWQSQTLATVWAFCALSVHWPWFTLSSGLPYNNLALSLSSWVTTRKPHLWLPCIILVFIAGVRCSSFCGLYLYSCRLDSGKVRKRQRLVPYGLPTQFAQPKAQQIPTI